jgi:predicted  nucleic acid-binding Zn-ribbon protein
MGLFAKKYLEPGQEQAAQEPPKKETPENVNTDSKIGIEITKLKAQFDQFSELRKVFNERFTRINEQVGELRGMIMDTNRSIQDIEVKVVKAVDLVEAVHPDKLMVDVRKQDAKIEALKANLESNEAMMKSLLEQLKDLRHQLSSFRGIEDTVKLSEEVKKELLNVKKVEATVERHADKIESIFIESQKRFQDFEKIDTRLSEMEKLLKGVTQQADQNKTKIQTLAQKKDMENLISKFNNFEKHMSNIIDLITRRSNELPKDVNYRFDRLEKTMKKAFDNRLDRAEGFAKILREIEKRSPQLAEELNISQVLKEGAEVEITSGESGAKDETAQVKEEHKGFFAKIFNRKKE